MELVEMVTNSVTELLEFLRRVSSGYNPCVAPENDEGIHDHRYILDYALDSGFVEYVEEKGRNSVRLTRKGKRYSEMM